LTTEETPTQELETQEEEIEIPDDTMLGYIAGITADGNFFLNVIGSQTKETIWMLPGIHSAAGKFFDTFMEEKFKLGPISRINELSKSIRNMSNVVAKTISLISQKILPATEPEPK